MSEIMIRRGLLEDIGELLREAKCRGKAAVISDETVAALYLDRTKKALERAGFKVCAYAVPAGEASKSIACYAQVLGFLADQGMTRSDTVVALGGGVVGDLAGFAAATYMRGIKAVQVPTTLLACVDSSVGGKTGIDLPQGKNLAGAFWQPVLTLIDPDMLRSLPSGVYRDGLAEVIKYAAIRDERLYNLLPYELDEEEEVIRRCVDIKRDIVAGDERDAGERQLLNFGHSFGHAIERLSDYSIPHGQAVAIGMCLMARAALKMDLCAKEDAGKLIGMIHVLGLPTECPYREDEVFDAMLADKKRAGDRITLVMFHGIGDCRLHSYSLDEARQVLGLGLSS